MTTDAEATRVALASNVWAYRQINEMTQNDLVAQMRAVGHRWYAATVSEIERNRRNITAPELASLSEIFDIGVDKLLDAAGPFGGAP